MFAYTSGLSLSSGSAAAGIMAMTGKAAVGPSLADGQQSAIDELTLTTNSNLAMAYLKLNNADKAIYFANKVSHPTNQLISPPQPSMHAPLLAPID